MKFTTVLFATVLATTASASAKAEANAQQWCHRPGEPCSKLKRAAEAAAEALAAPGPSADPEAIACYAAGAPCNLAKREALAMAEAVAEAHAAAYAGAGMSILSRVNRQLLTRDAEAHQWCYRPGEPCSKVKRAAEAMAKALAEPVAEPEAKAEAHQWCYRKGEPCSKAKRGVDSLEAIFKN